mmetsp:Transcript_3009/g.6483  ORF Transcript_3009/g.6483 Transcript_3009/m.6483 type:complete len:91 (-) Transcript_3009:437-709(-)
MDTRGSSLSDAINPSDRLSFEGWVENWVHENDVLRLNKIQPIGTISNWKEQDANIRLGSESRHMLVESLTAPTCPLTHNAVLVECVLNNL